VRPNYAIMILGAIAFAGSLGYLTYSNYAYMQNRKNNLESLEPEQTNESLTRRDVDDEVEDD